MEYICDCDAFKYRIADNWGIKPHKCGKKREKSEKVFAIIVKKVYNYVITMNFGDRTDKMQRSWRCIRWAKMRQECM